MICDTSLGNLHDVCYMFPFLHAMILVVVVYVKAVKEL